MFTDNGPFQGSTPALFVGTTAFEVIVKQQIKRLEDPAQKCCQLVYDELIRILGQMLGKIVSRYLCVESGERICHLLCLAIFQAVPRAAGEVQRCSCQLLQDCHEPDDETGVGYGRVSVEINTTRGGRTLIARQDASMLCKHDAPRLFERSHGMNAAAFVKVLAGS